jgi:hypothetical protein
MRTHNLCFPFIFFALISAFSCLASAQQDAEVTFYSGGSYWVTGLPGDKHGNFFGAIFDGQERIAVLRRGRFFTMHMRPGQHVFSGSLSGKHPAKNSQLALDLLENGQYFIRAESDARGIGVVDSTKGILTPVSCQIAEQETVGKKPLEAKHVSKNAMSRLLDVNSVPACSRP